MKTIKVVGVDAAFSNMGFAHAEIAILQSNEGAHIERLTDLRLTTTQLIEDRKVVRKSSTELRRAMELTEALRLNCADAVYAFVEVPSGSQSSSAARALGIAVGVLASCPIPIIEVAPMEVKAVIAGGRVKKGATKAQIIEWVAERYPAAPWVRHQHNGKTFVKGGLQNCNEHLADAVLTIMAGVNTPEFQRMLPLLHQGSHKPTRRRISL